MQTPEEILQKYWGFNEFKGLQKPIIEAALQQQDVLAILPTGGGKSVCFQVSALLGNGLCIVVSPLIALMKDQVQNLQRKNIAAIALHSGLTSNEVEDILENAANNKYKFLYLSPERLQSKLFNAYLPKLNICLIAVDEAHCISQWGYDFRPPYLKIISLRESKPKVPVIALTASATAIVQQDIIDKLKLKTSQIFQQSFDKPNLSYSVFKVDSKINKAIEILNNVQGSGIVYCKNRRQTTYVAQLLQLQNISADFYHAGLPQNERSDKQNNWVNNKTRVIVCTNAFGMGIDKPDVRTVIHYDVPDCLENYYQEAGRAGRDGKRAYAILLYHSKDVAELSNSSELKYPPIAEIKKVYQAIANYLQIPVGLGQGNYYDFDIISFTKTFNLDVHLVMNVLKTLEHEGHIIVTESVFLPSKVQVIADRFTIEEFCKTYPNLENVLKGLLRSYSGILDNETSINEKQLAKVCHLPYNIVDEQLLLLAKHRMINFIPQKESPQIFFNLNRAQTEILFINEEQYFKRKQQYIARVNAMLKYIEEEKLCRSKIISNYFNAITDKDCSCCDNCLRHKNVTLSTEEFKQIELKIMNIIAEQSLSTKDLLNHFKTIKKEKFWKVLQFLQDKSLLFIDEKGMVSLKNNL